MRKFVQAFVVVVGFLVAIAAVETEQRKPSGSCYEIAAPTAPTACN